MSVLDQTIYTESTANGVTTVYPYTFQVLNTNDLVVSFDNVVQSSGYTISGIGNPSGGNITFSSAPAAGVIILRKRLLPLQRLTDYQDNGDFLADNVNNDLDRLWQFCQQIQQYLKNAIKLPFTTSSDQTINQDAAARQNNVISFDSSGNVVLLPASAGTSLVDLSAPTGSSLVGHAQGGAGSAATTVQAKLRESVSIDDFTGTDTVATQSAVNVARVVKFIAGNTYNLTGDITVPSDTKIIVEKGATVINTGGRFTSYNQNNVEYVIDGVLSSIAIATAPAKTGWPNTAAGTQFGDERGFVEFGGSDLTTASVSGFKVSGSGKVIGDWTGTPNFSDSVFQVNRKGIASWNCKNVDVKIEVSGFNGEAIYFFGNTPDCVNVKLDGNHAHHNRFNDVNLNVSNVTYSGANHGLSASDNTTHDSFCGVEASAGKLIGNRSRNHVDHGLWFGLGAGASSLIVADNTDEDCQNIGFGFQFSSALATPIHSISIHDNHSIGAGTDAFVFNKLTGVSVKNNTSRGHARLGAGRSFAFTNCTEGWVDGNITFAPGAFSTGNMTSVTSSLTFGSNPVILPGAPLVTANGTHYGFGGYAATVTTFGNRENQFAAWSSDFNVIGTGAEYIFKNGSVGNTIYATLSGKGGSYDGSGSTGGVVIATKKANTAQALPTATAEFKENGDTALSGALEVNSAVLIKSNTTLTNGAGAGTGTLTNAPTAGPPSKWIAINDNGTFRYIPSWIL